MKKIIFCYVTICFISCTNKNKRLDFEKFHINVPATWNKIEIKGIDSNVYAIVTENSDSIFLDFGKYSESFNETNKVFSREQIQKYKMMKMETKALYFSDNPEIDQAQGTFLKEYYYYDTIDNIAAKLKIPKIPSKGETGIHFANIDRNGNYLTIIGKNLNSKEQTSLIEAFKTIKVKK